MPQEIATTPLGARTPRRDGRTLVSPRRSMRLWAPARCSTSVPDPGTTSPPDGRVVAVEPSLAHARPAGRSACSGRARRRGGAALRRPSFDVAMAVLTIHHWSDPGGRAPRDGAGGRATGRVLLRATPNPRLLGARVLPGRLVASHGAGSARRTAHRRPPRPARDPAVARAADCTDGFGVAFWARPEAYLDADVQAGMSWLALLSESERERGFRSPASRPRLGTMGQPARVPPRAGRVRRRIPARCRRRTMKRRSIASGRTTDQVIGAARYRTPQAGNCWLRSLMSLD